MTNFTIDESKVRVDLFKPSGKWYDTKAIHWLDYTGYIHEAFKLSIQAGLGTKYEGMTAVCLHPYHKDAHPLMLKL